MRRRFGYSRAARLMRGVAAGRSAQRGTSGATTGGGGRAALPRPVPVLSAQARFNSRKQVLTHGVGLFQKRVAVDLEDAHADFGVLGKQLRDGVVRADPRGAVRQVGD